MKRLIRNLTATGQIYSFPRRHRPLKGGSIRKSGLGGEILPWTINALVWGTVAAVIWGIR